MIDQYVRESVAVELSTGKIVEFSHTQPVFDLVEAGFPLGLNRIAWERVRQKDYAEIFPVGTGGKKIEDIESRLMQHRGQVEGWLNSAGISLDNEALWVGDSADIGLRMGIRTLFDCFPRLFSLPQHSYVLPENGLWCLNYVMEGELFFAKAPKK